MTVTFSAGNDGMDANADGGIDDDSLGAPATAKNVITVGASENDRASDYACDATKSAVCAAQGGQNDIFTCGSAWPFELPRGAAEERPERRQRRADGGLQQPRADRRRPHQARRGGARAPGCSPATPTSTSRATTRRPIPRTGRVPVRRLGIPAERQATSTWAAPRWPNPLVAGGAAVVRDFYQKLHGHSASAALVKATLVNSAVDLLDENNDGVERQRLSRFRTSSEGWGRVDLAAATDGSREFVDDGPGLATGGVASHSYDVAGGTPFKVTLAWSDYPGNPSATKMLVNDLDLEVIGPGRRLLPAATSSRAGGWSVARRRRRQHEQRRERLRAVPGRGQLDGHRARPTTCPRGPSRSPSSWPASRFSPSTR